MPAFVIDRSQFTHDSEDDCFRGVVVLNGLTYEGTIKSWDGNTEKAWSNAQRVFEFVEKHFDRIENDIRGRFVSEVRHWTEEEEEQGYDDDRLAKLILEAMRGSEPARFSIYAEWISELYYDGPRFLLGHEIMIQFAEDGDFLSVLMSG